jgi:uncharacterized protein (DUF2235 family)
MAKDIVLLFDGTGNAVEVDQTNILRLYRCLKKDERQLVYYIPGVGTFGGDDRWSTLVRNVIHVFGMATGWGLDQSVLDGYAFLCNHYARNDRVRAGDEDGEQEQASGQEEPDRIWLFGFSRGAYAARVLAGFVHCVGLMDPIQLTIARYALDTYKKGDFEALRVYPRTIPTRRVPIHFMGLFDTVSAIIRPLFDSLNNPNRESAFTKTNPSVRAVRHALAIDERRAMFRCSLWKDEQEYWGGPFRGKNPVAQDVKQVWFCGVHSDVGGGYKEEESGLSKITLEWMIGEIKAAPDALRLVTQTVNRVALGNDRKNGVAYAAPSPLAKLHNSMNIGWALTEFIPNRINAVTWPRRPRLGRFYWPLFAPRRIPRGASVDQSVNERIAGVKGYRPRNLPPGAP